LDKLNESQLGDLYLWLLNEYPRSEDPDFSNETMAHFVGPREEMTQWRDSIIDRLKDRGTAEAVEVLQEILTLRPELDWLKFSILTARDRVREKSWEPFPLTQLRELLGIDTSVNPIIKSPILCERSTKSTKAGIGRRGAGNSERNKFKQVFSIPVTMGNETK